MNEKLSELMDGELDANMSARSFAEFKGDRRAQEAWNSYHLIGDALRGEPFLARDMSAVIARRLADEPTVLAPRRAQPRFVARHAMPLAASVAAIGFVGFAAWQLMRTNPVMDAPAQIAKNDVQLVQPVAADAKEKGVSPRIRPARVPSSYLLAHQEFAPGYAVESAPMLARTVSLQREDAGR